MRITLPKEQTADKKTTVTAANRKGLSFEGQFNRVIDSFTRTDTGLAIASGITGLVSTGYTFWGLLRHSPHVDQSFLISLGSFAVLSGTFAKAEIVRLHRKNVLDKVLKNSARREEY